MFFAVGDSCRPSAGEHAIAALSMLLPRFAARYGSRSPPAFAAYLKYTYEEETVMSPDGSTRHLVYQLARRAILEPTDETRMRTRATTIEYLQVQARAGLRKMHDDRTVLPSYLTSQDGALCASKVGRAHADTIGCENTIDRFSESVFLLDH